MFPVKHRGRAAPHVAAGAGCRLRAELRSPARGGPQHEHPPARVDERASSGRAGPARAGSRCGRAGPAYWSCRQRRTSTAGRPRRRAASRRKAQRRMPRLEQGHLQVRPEERQDEAGGAVPEPTSRSSPALRGGGRRQDRRHQEADALLGGAGAGQVDAVGPGGDEVEVARQEIGRAARGRAAPGGPRGRHRLLRQGVSRRPGSGAPRRGSGGAGQWSPGGRPLPRRCRSPGRRELGHGHVHDRRS